MQGLGSLQYQTGRGIFLPQGYGGGIFDGNLAGGGLGYSVSSLPWLKYSSDTMAFQKDVNMALRDMGEKTITEDGKLGPNTCAAAKKAASRYDYIKVPPECNKSHTSAPAPSAPALPAEPLSPSRSSMLTPGGGRGMSSTTKNALIFVGAGVLAIGGAYFVMKKK